MLNMKYKVVVKAYVQYSGGELELSEWYEEEFDSFAMAERAMKEEAECIGCRGMWLEARINETLYMWEEI